MCPRSRSSPLLLSRGSGIVDSRQLNNRNSAKHLIPERHGAPSTTRFPNGNRTRRKSAGALIAGKRTVEGENARRSLSYFNARELRSPFSLVRDEIDNYPALYALPLIRAISTRAHTARPVCRGPYLTSIVAKS